MPTVTDELRVVIVDDQRVHREGLGTLLTGLSGGEVRIVGSTGDARSALVVVSTEDVDAVLVDLGMTSPSGPDLVRQLIAIDPRLPVVVVTGTSNPALVLDALDAGAVGVVPRLGDPAVVLDALRLAARGGAVIPPGLLRRLLKTRTSTVIELDLTTEDVELWRLIVSGETMEEIADQRHVSVRTAKRQVARLYKKLGVAGRIGAAELAGRVALDHP